MQEKTNKPALRFKGFDEDWEQRKLGDCFWSLPNNTLSRAELSYENGVVMNVHYGDVLIKFDECLDVSKERLPFIEKQSVAEKIKTSYLKNGDVIVADTAEDETVGKCTEIIGLTDQKVLSGLHTIPLRPNEQFATGYLGFYLNSAAYHRQLKPLMQGIKVTSISKSAIQDTVIKYPLDIREQALIGQYFMNLDHLITLHQRKYTKLVNIKKSMLEKMFPKNGEDVPEIRFAGFTDPWEQRKVSDVANRFDNLRIPVAANLRIPGTTPYYGANGIQDYVEGFTHEGEFVLVAEDGANDLKNYPVKYVNGRIWVNNHAHVLQGKFEILENKFFAYSISQINIEALLVGGGRAKLNAEVMMSLELYIPNFNEQKFIGRYFAQLDQLITLHQRKLEKLQHIKKACLEKMFV